MGSPFSQRMRSSFRGERHGARRRRRLATGAALLVLVAMQALKVITARARAAHAEGANGASGLIGFDCTRHERGEPTMRVPHAAWVVVADGGKFLILENAGDAERVDLRVVRRGEQDNPPTREQGADRPGRFDDVGVGRSSVEQTDWHEIAKERFAGTLAEKLRGWALRGRFRHLVLVADPSTLGELRGRLHEKVKDALQGELDKDLTNLPVDAIEKALAAA